MKEILSNIGTTGKLPTIETSVGMDTKSIINIAVGLFLAGVSIIIAYKIILKK